MYELWDLPSGNLVATFATQTEALAWVRQSLLDDGPEFAGQLALIRLDPERQRTVTVEGAALAELARTTAPAA